MKKTKEQKTDEVIDSMTKKLDFAVDSYVELMTSNSKRNAKMLEDFNKDWKKEATRVNTIQKLIKFGYEDFQIALSLKLETLKTK